LLQSFITNWPTDWEKDKEITAIITQCWNSVKCDAKPEEGGDCKQGEIDCENNGQCYTIRWVLVSYKEKGVTKWKLKIRSMYPKIKPKQEEPEKELPEKEPKPTETDTDK
jgi:hypothetical protein